MSKSKKENMELLVFEDDLSIVNMLKVFFERHKYNVRSSTTVSGGLSLLADKQPDIIIMDWMLPDRSGIEAIRQIRREQRFNAIPIIMLTAKSSEDDTIMGLNNGADDYVAKPFSSKELLARVQANLRRVPTAKDIFRVDGLEVDVESHKVAIDESEISLGPIEFKLLHFFIARQEKVFSREQLLDSVWGGNVYLDDRTVDVHIRRLRAKLEPYGYENYIKTVRGSGYIFSKPKLNATH
jgi:two-component system phosphate regulon response regulator PhoB